MDIQIWIPASREFQVSAAQSYSPIQPSRVKTALVTNKDRVKVWGGSDGIDLLYEY